MISKLSEDIFFFACRGAHGVTTRKKMVSSEILFIQAKPWIPDPDFAKALPGEASPERQITPLQLCISLNHYKLPIYPMDPTYLDPDVDSVVEVYIDLDYTTYQVLQNEAQKAGVPYHTLISNILHKYASGKLKHET